MNKTALYELFKYSTLGAAFLIISSCAHKPMTPVGPTMLPPMFDLSLASLTEQPPFVLSQLLTFDFPGKQDQIQIEIEHKKNRTIFVGFGALGNELFTILIQEGKLVTTGRFKGVDPKFIVDHFMLSFLPVEDLQDDLKQKGYQLQQTSGGRIRTLMYGDRKVVEIRYSEADHFLAEARLNNMLLDYAISIKNGKKNTAHEG